LLLALQADVFSSAVCWSFWQVGAVNCTACALGTFALSQGQSSCEFCAKGEV
jgi:hypothetical protein